jgi:uncharacterized protein
MKSWSRDDAFRRLDAAHDSTQLTKGGRPVRLDHEFTVPAPIGEVWQAVIDPERVAPCMPGAALTTVEGDTFAGTVKVKAGPVSLQYKGSGEFLEKGEAAGKVVIKASGRDSGGGGTAAATITLTLTERDGGTHGAVATDLAITGRPAQFGRGMISEVGGKLLGTFAENLAKTLEQSGEKSRLRSIPPTPVKTEPVKTEPINLLDYAGQSLLKRLLPVAGGTAVLIVVLMILRSLRKR